MRKKVKNDERNITTMTNVRNENDLKELRRIIEEQNARGANLPNEYNWQYVWNAQGRLVEFCASRCGMSGDLCLSGLDALEYVGVSENELTGLDVSDLQALQEVHCSHNQLTAIHMAGCNSLSGLNCNYNHLRELDLSGLSSLNKLYCNENQISRLDTSECPLLTWVGHDPEVECNIPVETEQVQEKEFE